MSSETPTGDDLANLIETETGDGDDGISVILHPRTNRLEVATRWDDWCEGCGELIRSGAVGPAIHEDPKAPSGDGVHSFQHGCGARNLPTSEVTDMVIDPNALAEAALDAAGARLREMIAREQREAAVQERRDLARELAETRAEYDRRVAEGDEEAADDLLSADDEVRGVGFPDEQSPELIAWSERYGQIALAESDLAKSA